VRGNPAVVARLFSLPPLSATAAALVGEALSRDRRSELPGDPEQASVNLRCIVAEPVPVLRLQTSAHTRQPQLAGILLRVMAADPFDVALPVFRYADVEVIPDDTRDFTIAGQRRDGSHRASARARRAADGLSLGRLRSRKGSRLRPADLRQAAG
jgi:hypothetical protein